MPARYPITFGFHGASWKALSAGARGAAHWIGCATERRASHYRQDRNWQVELRCFLFVPMVGVPLMLDSEQKLTDGSMNSRRLTFFAVVAASLWVPPMVRADIMLSTTASTDSATLSGLSTEIAPWYSPFFRPATGTVSFSPTGDCQRRWDRQCNRLVPI